MPRKKDADAAVEAAVTPADGSDLGVFEEAEVDLLPDGRVQATVKGLREPNDELSYKCSQGRTARYLLNDVAPVIK